MSHWQRNTRAERHCPCTNPAWHRQSLPLLSLRPFMQFPCIASGAAHLYHAKQSSSFRPLWPATSSQEQQVVRQFPFQASHKRAMWLCWLRFVRSNERADQVQGSNCVRAALSRCSRPQYLQFGLRQRRGSPQQIVSQQLAQREAVIKLWKALDKCKAMKWTWWRRS